MNKYKAEFMLRNGNRCYSELELTEEEIENISSLIEEEKTYIITGENILIINMKYVQSVLFTPIDNKEVKQDEKLD